MKKKHIALIVFCLVLLLLAACSDPEMETAMESEMLPQTITTMIEPTESETPGPTYAVTFYSDDGTILKIDRVLEGETAIPPVEPQMSYGRIFLRWQEDYAQVRENREIHPECRTILKRPNVFALTGATGRTGENSFVSLLLCGEVQVSGFDLTVNYDPEALLLESVYNEDGSVVYNDETPGEILINYVSIKNTIANVDLCSFKFRVLAESGETPLSIQMNSIYANESDNSEDLITPEYEIFDSVIRIDR